jgi:hypothetical protein
MVLVIGTFLVVPVAGRVNEPKRPLNRSNPAKSPQNAPSTGFDRSSQIRQISMEEAGFSAIRPHIKNGFEDHFGCHE